MFIITVKGCDELSLFPFLFSYSFPWTLSCPKFGQMSRFVDDLAKEYKKQVILVKADFEQVSKTRKEKDDPTFEFYRSCILLHRIENPSEDMVEGCVSLLLDQKGRLDPITKEEEEKLSQKPTLTAYFFVWLTIALMYCVITPTVVIVDTPFLYFFCVYLLRKYVFTGTLAVYLSYLLPFFFCTMVYKFLPFPLNLKFSDSIYGKEGEE